MIKRITAILALVVAGAIGSVAVAAPAQAADTSYLYVYDASNFVGPNYIFSAEVMSNGCYNFGIDPHGFNWNDKVDSITFDSWIDQTLVNFYTNSGCSGTVVTWVKNQMYAGNWFKACTQPASLWNGACGSSGISSMRIQHY